MTASIFSTSRFSEIRLLSHSCLSKHTLNLREAGVTTLDITWQSEITSSNLSRKENRHIQHLNPGLAGHCLCYSEWY